MKINSTPTPLVRLASLWLQRIVELGLILMMGVSMGADAGGFGLSGAVMSWKEEVLLHDGQTIVVERLFNLGGYPALESRERATLDETVTFSQPGTSKRIVWKTDFRDSKPEPNSLNLILLDIVDGVPYSATYPAGCIAYNKWKRPNPPQVLFKYEDDQWKRIALAEFPAALSKANVIVGRPASSLLQPYYTVAQVNEQNHDISTPEYKTVLRETVKGGEGLTSCPDYNSRQYRSPKAPLPMKPRNEQQNKQ